MSGRKCIAVLFLSFVCIIFFSKEIELKGQDKTFSRVISFDGTSWEIATDSSNEGRHMEWFNSPPVSGFKKTPVPWVIQDIFHNYHGVVWYWRNFFAPVSPHVAGRYILRFSAVDYLADVWVNGKYAGGHEGSETPFDLDITDMIRNEGKNLLVVRVLNPTYEPIDGIALKSTPSGAKQYPFTGNASYNSGGIIGDVELHMVPPVRINNLFVVPDWKTGRVTLHAEILNAGESEAESLLSFRITEAKTGLRIVTAESQSAFKKGINKFEIDLQVPGHKLWSPKEPFLYRIEAFVQTLSCVDECSVRFGFRDFHFENGYFRLNGERIFLKGTNFSTHFPVSYTVPLNEEMLIQDAIKMKALGFNFVRIPFGCPNSRVLDIYDDLGIMVQQEHFGCWQIGDYGGYKIKKEENNDELLMKRFENSIREVVIRDRNHPSLVMWGVLNENSDGIIFRKAVSILPSLRQLDPSRIFVLNSGRFDGRKEIGSMSNPGSLTWDVREDELKDWHPYVWMPYSKETLDLLSGRLDSSGRKCYISETGLCFPIDLPSELSDYQQCGKEQSDDALYFRRQYNKFLADWQKFGLGDCWENPEEYIRAAYVTAASLRETAESAIRSNPFVVSYTPTNGVADAVAGESIATNFRRIKPELIGSVLLSNAQVRWCLRTEPQSIYSGDSIQLKVSFSNLDLLHAGKYPATIMVVDQGLKKLFEKKIYVTIPDAKNGDEPPFAREIINQDILVAGPAGKYSLIATLDSGAVAEGGQIFFFVSKREVFPKIPEEITVAGIDPVVEQWLKNRNVRIIPFAKNNEMKRQLIIVAGNTPDSLTMINIACQMEQGSAVVFLSPSTFRSRNNSTRWLPLVNKGSVEPMDAVAGYYRADRWVKNHPVFDGMPSGGMMDYTYFRNIISQDALSQEYTVVAKSLYTYDEVTRPLTYPSEVICGATRISHNYCSGVHLGVWNFGYGKFIVNTLRIEENLGRDPAADRLFYNILNFASAGLDKPKADLPSDFEKVLVDIGYTK